MNMYPGHATLWALREGKIIDLDGMLFRMDGDGTVASGDTYVGARNTVDIYTCERVEDDLLWPEGPGYTFYESEGVKVRAVEADDADYTVPRDVLKSVVLGSANGG